MAGQPPSINDTEYALWKKIAWNWYEYAINFGVTGVEAPNWNDSKDILMKKTAYTTAKIVDTL